MSRTDFLRAEVTSQLVHFDNESRKHKNLYRWLRYAVFFLTGISTLLAGAAISFKEYQTTLNLLVVMATATVGAITSVEGLRKPAELWILERNVYYALKDLQREIEYATSITNSTVDVEKYFERLQQILISSTEKWARHVAPAKDIRA